jgi:Tol biopolymer transport system component
MTFISDRAIGFQYDVYVADEKGNNPRALGLTKLSSYNQSPIFASDGKSVYVLAGLEKNSGSRAIYSLYQLDLSGKTTEIADSNLFNDPDHWKPK